MVSTEPTRTTTIIAESHPKLAVCCSSSSSMCYWFAVSLAAWGVLSLLGLVWHPLHASSAATILFAAGIGCFANWTKNRTFHCSITAWIFLAAAVVFLLGSVGLIHIEPRFIWPFVAIGTAFSFILEWQFASRPAR